MFSYSLHKERKNFTRFQNANDCFSSYPLHYAVRTGNREITKSIIKNGTKVDSLDLHERTPLYYAVLSGNQEVANILVDSGANVNYDKPYGQSLLHHAIEFEDEAMVVFLLESGANPNSISIFYNKSVLYFACLSGQKSIVKILLDYGADVEGGFKEDILTSLRITK